MDRRGFRAYRARLDILVRRELLDRKVIRAFEELVDQLDRREFRVYRETLVQQAL